MSKGRFILKVVVEFSAAHVIKGYNGPCARLHGHNWTVEAQVETRKLDEIGIGYDFRDLKKKLKVLTESLDHRHLNEIPPFDKINPTAENLACWIHENLYPDVDTEDAKLIAIIIWENNRSAVEYRID